MLTDVCYLMLGNDLNTVCLDFTGVGKKSCLEKRVRHGYGFIT